MYALPAVEQSMQYAVIFSVQESELSFRLFKTYNNYNY